MAHQRPIPGRFDEDCRIHRDFAGRHPSSRANLLRRDDVYLSIPYDDSHA